MDVFGTAVMVALFVGVPLWVIADVALDALDKRRGIEKVRYSLGKYLFAIVVLLFLCAASITVF